VNPVDDSDLYDALVLGGRVSPGVCVISGLKSEQKWDVKEADGQDGASTTHKGAQLRRFTATFTLAKDEQGDDFAAWESYAALIESTVAGKDPVALDCYHPLVAAAGLTAVVKGSVGQLVPDGKGGATVAVELLEYRPPKKKSGSPQGSKSKAPGGPGAPGAPPGQAAPDPNAQAKADLAKLVEEANAP